MQDLLEFIKKLQSDKRFASFDEVATKQGIVLKILSLLEWDPFDIDEIQPEYTKGGKKVSFSLRSNNSDKAFIVVEKREKNLENAREGLIDFAAKENVAIAVLTNGLTWWFFSPHLGANAEQNNFLRIQMSGQQPEEITKEFLDFLSKQNLVSGKAVQSAKNRYQAKQKEMLIRQHLPKAWQGIMKEPEKWLVDIMVEATADLCGYKPDKETVQDFLSSDSRTKVDTAPKTKSEPPPRTLEAKSSVQASYIGKSLASFTFQDKKYPVKSWKDMLLKVCEQINAEHKDNFEFLINLSTQEEGIFSKDEHRILISEKIPGTDIYVNVDLTPKETVALCYEILSVFGYREKDLSIDAK